MNLHFTSEPWPELAAVLQTEDARYEYKKEEGKIFYELYEKATGEKVWFDPPLAFILKEKPKGDNMSKKSTNTKEIKDFFEGIDELISMLEQLNLSMNSQIDEIKENIKSFKCLLNVDEEI